MNFYVLSEPGKQLPASQLGRSCVRTDDWAVPNPLVFGLITKTDADFFLLKPANSLGFVMETHYFLWDRNWISEYTTVAFYAKFLLAIGDGKNKRKIK